MLAHKDLMNMVADVVTYVFEDSHMSMGKHFQQFYISCEILHRMLYINSSLKFHEFSQWKIIISTLIGTWKITILATNFLKQFP